MIRVLLYVGFGALLHVVFVGSSLDWQSAATLMWILAWPLALVWQFFNAIVILASIVLLICLSAWLWGSV